MRRITRMRTVRCVALLGLLATLAFGACAPRNARQGGYSGASGNASGQATTQNGGQISSTPAAANPDIQSVENMDNALQGGIPSLNSASNDANTDYSTQDNPTIP